MSSNIIQISEISKINHYNTEQDSNANPLNQNQQKIARTAEGTFFSSERPITCQANPTLDNQFVILQPSAIPDFPNQGNAIWTDLVKAMSMHSIDRDSQAFKNWYPRINRLTTMDQLSTFENNMNLKSESPYSTDLSLILRMIQQSRVLMHYLDHVQDEAELLKFKSFVIENPHAFDVDPTLYKIDTRLLNRELQRWLEDPNATGDKDEAVALIKEAFHYECEDLELCKLELNSLPRCLNLLTHLRDLNLSHNKFTQLPNLDLLTQLLRLNISHNPFEPSHLNIGNLKIVFNSAHNL